MLKNYLKIAVRSLLRKRVYAFINLLGLAVGIACALLLYLFIQDEFSFDKYHHDKEQVYRLESEQVFIDQHNKSVVFSALFAAEIQKNYSEIIHTVKIRMIRPMKVAGNKTSFYQKGMVYADPAIFQTLTYTSLVGDLQQALKQPNAIVLTRSISDKLFATPKHALGETITLDGANHYTVTAIIQDVPANSHFRPTALIAMQAYRNKYPKIFTSANNNSFPVYIKLKKGTNIQGLEKALSKSLENFAKTKARLKNAKSKLYLVSLKDIYFRSRIKAGYAAKGNAEVVYIFMLVAFLIVLIACINYMNLATARSAERAKEVGIRKVVGSLRSHLIKLFLTEALLLSFLATFIGVSLAELCLPWFNQLAGKELAIHYITQPEILLILLSGATLIGLLSGIYPAFVLSSFKPVQVLKGRFSHSLKGKGLRKGLVIFQFSISVIMIISTWVVYQQMQYVRKKNLGFDKEQMYLLPFFGLENGTKYEVIRSQLLQSPHISKVTYTSLGMDGSHGGRSALVELENGERVKSAIKQFYVAPHYFSVMGMQLTQGRNFDKKLQTDRKNSLIVNEAFAQQFGWKKPIGKKVGKATVIGVVKNFHIKSLYATIDPFIMQFPEKEEEAYNALPHFFIKLHPNNLSSGLRHIKKVWQAYNVNLQYNGRFIDQYFARDYQEDQRRGKIFLLFSLLTIFIACMGLLGLASFTAWQRTKEIGIRKVLGASVQSLLILLNRDFVKLILIACLLAFPIAYYFMSQWLQNFAYRTPLHWEVFVGSGFLILCIALLTISIQSLRVTRVNPADVLKDE